MSHDATPEPPGQRKANRDAQSRAREERSQANRLEHSVLQATKMAAKLEQTDAKAAEAMLCVAILDLSAAGLSISAVAERLQRPRDFVQRLYDGAMQAATARQSIAAEQIRYGAQARLDALYNKLTAEQERKRVIEEPDGSKTEQRVMDSTSYIRSIEVQARIIGQTVDLYGAKVRETDADLSAAVQDVIREARQLDRDQIGLEQPASRTLTAEPAEIEPT